MQNIAGAATAKAVRLGRAPLLPAGATRIDALPAATPLKIEVVLRPRDADALAAFATAVSTPGNPLFHHYLARGEFAGRFGATATVIANVSAALRRQGLSVGAVSANALSIRASGTAATVGAAFGTGFDRYRLASGRVAFANTTAPLLSSGLAGTVQAVIGLDTLVLPTPMSVGAATRARAKSLPHVVTGGPQPCQAAIDAGAAAGGYTADQLASAYRFTSLYGAGNLGRGVTVALPEFEGNWAPDVAAYQACYNTSATVNYVPVDGGQAADASTAETDLDIETVIGLAPKATIDVYQAANTGLTTYDMYAQMVNDDTAQVVSSSWGICELDNLAFVQAESAVFQQAAAQGQSVFAASGDTGSEGCNDQSHPPETDNRLVLKDPAAQPFVTGVGGTTLSALGPAPTERVWDDNVGTSGLGGGGGVSAAFAMPSYQADAPASLHVANAHSSGVPCNAAAGSTCREVPDVSADADNVNSGYIIFLSVCGGWCDTGGTSAASPLWGALTAAIDSAPTCGRVGFANPKLYDAAATAYSANFNDVTNGNNDALGTNGGLYPAGTGYDMASGLGTPNAAGLAVSLCASVSAVTFAGNVAVPTITVTGSGFGTVANLGTGVAACGPSRTGFNYANNFFLADTSSAQSWTAGRHAGGVCDQVGVSIASYSNNQIVFSLGSGYSALAYHLYSGDPFTMTVLGTSLSGKVRYPGVLYAGSAATGTADCSSVANACPLTSALGVAVPGDAVQLTTPGATAVYGGGFSIGTSGPTAALPVTIEPAPGVANPTLDGGDAHTVLTVTNNMTLNVFGVTIQHGFAAKNGGGIANNAGGTVTVADSTFANNAATFSGGAIDNANGGGLHGTVTVERSTFSGNRATYNGGAIDNGNNNGTGTLEVTSSTFSGNLLTGITNTGGGAIDNGDNHGTGALYITSSTFVGNTAPAGNDIDTGDRGGTGSGWDLASIFAGGCHQTGSGWTDSGYNVGSDNSCLAGGTGDVVSANLATRLGPLANNGGPTQTVLLLSRNPASGRIPNPTGALCPVGVDQTGAASPPGAPCNAGALQAHPAITTVAISGTATAPIVTITGIGFGSKANLGAPNHGCGSASDFANNLYFSDTSASPVWTAGKTCDAVGLIISKYSNKKIVFGFGKNLHVYGSLQPGDQWTLTVLGATANGTS